MEITRKRNCKNLWLNTTDATTDGLRRVFTFNHLPLIQIRQKTYLKVNSITLSGAGHAEATGHNWTVKLHNVGYNANTYFNSDKNAEPTIVCFNFDTKHTIQNGLLSLELVPQDINNLAIEVFNEAGTGLIKSSQPVQLHINILLEEYDEY